MLTEYGLDNGFLICPAALLKILKASLTSCFLGSKEKMRTCCVYLEVKVQVYMLVLMLLHQSNTYPAAPAASATLIA